LLSLYRCFIVVYVLDAFNARQRLLRAALLAACLIFFTVARGSRRSEFLFSREETRQFFLFFAFPARGDRPTNFFRSSLSTRVVVDFHATGRPAVNKQSIQSQRELRIPTHTARLFTEPAQTCTRLFASVRRNGKGRKNFVSPREYLDSLSAHHHKINRAASITKNEPTEQPTHLPETAGVVRCTRRAHQSSQAGPVASRHPTNSSPALDDSSSGGCGGPRTSD
jgi:hypothetical protein